MSDAETIMRQALAEARAAATAGEVPIGCVIVHDPGGIVIGRGFNRRETDHDPTAHAEILALRQASQTLGTWRLTDCTVYVTLEPCPMCAGAIVNARVPRLVYGCDDPKAGAVRSLYRLCEDARLNHRVDVTGGILADECAAVLREFFQAQRAMGKK
jgi:tRNA(adenine34) deaminase